jgi:dihydroxyacid dehydratase/phosphogluconate dehydratase
MRWGSTVERLPGPPQIAIANTASELTPCNAHLDGVAGAVKQAVYEAGGIPLERGRGPLP